MNSDKSNEQEAIETKPVEKEEQEHGNRCGSPHLPMVMSVIALLLAGYAIVTASSSKGIASLEARLGELDSRISSNSNQLAALSADVQQNRNSLIQARLKEVLLSIQEINGMADEQTQRSIAEAEKILLSLTAGNAPASEPAEQAPEQGTADEVMPEPQPQTEEQAMEETVEQASEPGNAASPETLESSDTATNPEEPPAAEAAPEQNGETPAGDAPAQAL